MKIGAEIVSHGPYVTFQMAEVAVSRRMFRQIPLSPVLDFRFDDSGGR